MTDAALAIEIYDLKGLNCPLPVLKSAKRLASMPAGGRLWIETTDPLAGLDIPALCAQSGHRLIDSQTDGVTRRFLVERGA